MKKIRYKWVVVAICFFMVLICLGFCSSPKSLFIVPVTSALGVLRSEFAINDTARYVTTAVINIFFGFLIAKFGAKKLICFGISSLILSMITYSLATNIFMFALGGVLLGLGLSWTTTSMVGYVINHWCSEKRGTIMGAILASNGIGGTIAIQILAPVIASGDFGYKKAYQLAAAILLVLLLVIILFFKNPPANAEKVKITKKNRGQNWEGLSFADTLKKHYFYIALICIFSTGFVLQSISGIAAAFMTDVGLSSGLIANILSLHSLSLFAFKFLTGVLYDKFGLRVTISINCIASFVAIFSLALISNSSIGIIFAFVYGIISSLALPLETIMLPIYASDLFGQKSFEKILGIIISVNVFGYALGAPVSNLTFDITGSYKLMFYVSCAVMLLILLLLQFVITSSDKTKKLISDIG